MATMGGARSLDMEDKIGSLETGKKADIVIVDVHAPNMQPNYDAYATLAFAAYPENVRTTIVNGRLVVDDRSVTNMDMDNHMKEWGVVTKRVAAYAKTLE
jgi:cytosine/adenosine deaminase-related metal-dependent hydrolase